MYALQIVQWTYTGLLDIRFANRIADVHGTTRRMLLFEVPLS
jgi:hypothetical protein